MTTAVIYVCVATQNHAPTVGLLLWKVRQVLAEQNWEYHLLVLDDASTDETGETLDTYQRVLPMTVLRHDVARGYAASVEALLRAAVERTDRPKRDGVVTLPPDFTVSPAVLPELLKRFASGADLVVGETLNGSGPWGIRLVQRCAPLLLRPGISVPGVRDLTSGVYAIRLSIVRQCVRQAPEVMLTTEGPCANAELLARTAALARQFAAVPLATRGSALPGRCHGPLSTAMGLFRAGRTLRIPAPAAEVQRP